MKVKLEDLAAAMRESDVRQIYVDIAQGKVILLDEDMGEEEALNHVFDIEDDWEHYIPVPNVIDDDLPAIMQGFAETCKREETKERLLEALKGPGAVARFYHQVKHLLLKKAWEDYLDERLVEIARDWCEENQLEYEDKER